MDRHILEEHLAQAERHVEESRQVVERQRALIAALERDDHSTTRARELLARFEAIQQTHIEDRDRTAQELRRLPAIGPGKSPEKEPPSREGGS